MDFTEKANSLAEKMNSITKQLDLSEELVVEGDDIVGYVKEKTKDVQLYESTSYAEILNLETMTDDFKYVRDTLKETSDNARRVLSAISLDLLDSDDDKRASLVMSFAELNRSLVQAQDLFVKSYKEMANVLLSIDKIQKNAEKQPQTVNNNLTINASEDISTVDLIKRLRGE